jgi:hypothetical protein
MIMGRAGSFDDVEAAITWHPTDDNNIWSMNFLATCLPHFISRGLLHILLRKGISDGLLSKLWS